MDHKKNKIETLLGISTKPNNIIANKRLLMIFTATGSKLMLSLIFTNGIKRFF